MHWEREQPSAAEEKADGSASSRPAWVTVLIVWAASRAFFFAVGAIGHAFIGQADVPGGDPGAPGTLSYWAHWDGRWFSEIAVDGYDRFAATAFFPLYPLVVRGGTELGLGVALAGVIVSTLATLAALYFIYQLALRWHGERAALVSILTIAFFPTAFYLNAVYSDPLFLALTAGCFWSLHVRRDILLAGLFGCLAAATRNIGVLLLLPIAYECLRVQRVLNWKVLTAIAAPVFGLASYMVYLWVSRGDPLLFSKAYREVWGRGFANPFETLSEALERSADGVFYLWPPTVLGTSSSGPPYLLSNTLNVWFLLFGCSALILAVRRIPRGVLLYTVPATLAPLALDPGSFPLASYPRYVLVVFPLFIALGAVLARSWTATVIWLLASASLGAYLTLLFVTWRWVA
jgi:Mannosyltransferase (PIG-V)